MSTRYFALVIGIVFLVIGIAGFVPQFVHSPPINAPDVTVHQNHGYLFGLFPVNAIHNSVHILFGVWGLMAYRSMGGSIFFARAMAVIYGLLAILGLFPATYTTFGLIPIHGNDVWLHAVLALAGALFGWGIHRTATDTDTHYQAPPGTPHHA